MLKNSIIFDYIIKKLPLNDDLLKHAEVFDIANLSSSHFRSVEYFHSRQQRVFSFVKRVRTDFRESMNTSTLNALCSVKMDMKSRKTACYDQKYDPAAIKAAKSATVQHNTKA